MAIDPERIPKNAFTATNNTLPPIPTIEVWMIFFSLAFPVRVASGVMAFPMGKLSKPQE